jgi:bifunctional pyridoxal-dependent enzyme with beta-cystathionase and maltose regulon repressor activities
MAHGTFIAKGHAKNYMVSAEPKFARCSLAFLATLKAYNIKGLK